MKVEKIDYLWSVISMITVLVSYRKGQLINGLLIIYGLMLLLFLFHIWKIRRRFPESVAVYATVVDYHQSRKKKRGYFPIVRYTTAGGKEITSAYSVEEREQMYEIGSEELVCYDPDEPEFFYFSGREDELTRDYFRFIIFGGIIAAFLFLFSRL